MLFPNRAEPVKAPFVLNVARELARAHRVTVVAPIRRFPGDRVLLPPALRGGIGAPPMEVIDGITVHHPAVFLPPKLGRALHGFLYFAGILPLLRRLEREESFDVINAPYLYPDGFAAVLAGMVLRKPVILEAKGCDVNLLTRYALRRSLIRFACRRAAGVVTVNRDMKRTLEGLGVDGKKISVIVNGVSSETFKPLDRAECRRSLKLPQDRKIALFVGSLEPVKGVTYLIEAWRLLSVEKPEKKDLLVLVGAGSERPRLVQLIEHHGLSERIVLAGSRPQAEIPLWMNACDVLCLPSIREGSPNVLLEAVRCGRYVVASRVGGIPEIIASPEQGMLTSPGDPAGIARAVRQAFARIADPVPGAGTPVRTWRDSAVERLTLFDRISTREAVAS